MDLLCNGVRVVRDASGVSRGACMRAARAARMHEERHAAVVAETADFAAALTSQQRR